MPATLERPPPNQAAATLVDPQALMRIKDLELRAKVVVEGLYSGLHRSPLHGFSVEFTEYRQYTPGDDPRYLDWKLYARSDRYYIKRFEDETNLRCHLLVDQSRSMSYGSLGYTKSDYAATLAATLAYFLASQRDAVGLVTFDERINEALPPRYRPGHLRRLMLGLSRRPEGKATDLSVPLEHIAATVNKRGLVILISDLLAPADSLKVHLGALRCRGHEVKVFRLADPAERDFVFERPLQFEDLETGREMFIDPAAAREQYLRRYAEHEAALEAACGEMRVDYYSVTTNEPLENVLFHVLQP